MYFPGGIVGTDMSWQTGDVAESIRRLVDAGHRLATLDDSVQWGNNTHQGRVDTLYSTAQSSWGFNASKVNLLAVSGGAAPALNWAKNNLSKVQSIALVIPTVDIIEIDTEELVSLLGFDPVTQGPRSAYGGATPPTTHNPASNAASYSGIPIKLWASTTDNICTITSIVAFGLTAGATMADLGAIGHSASTLAADEIPAFFNANG